MDVNRENIPWISLGLILLCIIIIIFYSFVEIFLVSLFLYYSFRPLYNRLEKYIENDNYRASISVIAFILPFFIIVFYFILVSVSNLYKIYNNEVNGSISFIEYQSQINNILELISSGSLQQISGGNLSGLVLSLLDKLLNSLSLLSSLFISSVLVIIIVFYLLRDDKDIVKWYSVNFEERIPKSRKYFEYVDKDLQSIYYGNMLTIVVVSIISSIVFLGYNFVVPSSLEIPYVFLISIIAGVSSLLPITGIKIVYIPVYIYLSVLYISLGHVGLLWLPFTLLVMSFLLIDLIPEAIIRPYMANRNMHLGLVILSYIIGVMFFGFVGLFLGPLLLALTYNFLKIVLPTLLK